MSSRSDSLAPFASGHRLGKFEIIELLSSGGQAQVYLARINQAGQIPIARVLRHKRWFGATPEFIKAQQLCTIKVPLPRWVENLRDEHTYLLTPEIRHKHLMRLLPDAGDTTGERRKLPKDLWFTTTTDTTGSPVELPYIALPYEAGGSLKDVLDRRGRRPLAPATAIAITLQVADALNHLHTRCKLVHHDVSPSNILFREPLSVFRAQVPDCVLIDLAAADMPRTPRLRHIYGKKVYLAPERRTKPPKPIDWPVDVYGLGVTLYEMLAGRVPNSGTTPTTDLTTRLPHIREHQPELSEELGNLVMQTVEQDPARRPTLPELMRRLQATPEAIQPGALRGPWDTRSRWQAAVSAIAIAVMVAMLGIFAMRGPGAEAATPTPTPSPTATIAATMTPVPPPVTPSAMPTSTPAPSVTPTSTRTP